MNNAAPGKRTINGGIQVIETQVRQLHHLSLDAENLLRTLLRKPEEKRVEGPIHEAESKPTMPDQLYDLASEMATIIDRTGSILTEAKCMIE